MKKKKKNDCVALKDQIQMRLYERYKKMTDEERQAAIEAKLSSSDSPIASFWRQNVLRIAEKEAQYRRKKK